MSSAKQKTEDQPIVLTADARCDRLQKQRDRATETITDLLDLIAFFEARQGQLYGFRWKDWADFKSCAPSQSAAAADQIIGTGDGSTTSFQLCKTYASGGVSYIRPVTKPVTGSVMVEVDGAQSVEGAGFSVNVGTGEVTLTVAPSVGVVVRAGFEFDVPVRFDTDRILVSADSFNAGQIPDVPVVEVRV
ncbi:phage distal tail protein, Rcc01695 family [Antarctobacter jejuensis]|uniref:phage distal tail protein, Rcc01695 family n=1 Tax=Antarctobacter jejuensis TaxID=1439938 RepID=UPI003FCF2597